MILEKAQADAEHTRLARLSRAFQHCQHALTQTIATGHDTLAYLGRDRDRAERAAAAAHSTRGDAFTMRIDGRAAATRADAAALIGAWVTAHANHAPAAGGRELVT